MRKISPFIILTILIYASSLTSCALLKRNRTVTHNGIPGNDFNLPLVFHPAKGIKSHTLILILSGDGGWMDFEDELASMFAEKGINTIGFNSRSYFWEQKTPEETASAIALLLHKYSRRHNAKEIMLCGYSFGADVVPFIYNRLPEQLKNKVTVVALLSPFASSDFVVKTSDLLNISGDHKAYKVQPEVEKISIPTYCFYGELEDPKPLGALIQMNITLKLLPGDHRYDKTAYQEIIDLLTSHKKHF